MSRSLCWTALILASCSDSTGSGPPPDFALSTTDQWSGGALELHAANFDAHAAPPLVLVGTDTAPVVRVDASTFTVTLPPGPTGPVSLTAKVNGASYDLGQVRRYGLANRTNIGTDLQDRLLVAYLPGGPTLLGVPAGQYNLRSVNLRSGQVFTYDNLFPAFNGANLSDQAGLFALVDSTNYGGLWQVGPGTQANLQVPYDTVQGFFAYWFAHAATRVSDSVWVLCTNPGFGDNLVTMVGHPPAYHYQGSSEGDCQHLVYGTGASWALGLPGGGLVDVATGDLIYYFGYGRFKIAAPSADGSLIFAVHRDSIAGETLMAVVPGNQAVLHTTALPVGASSLVLSADPAGNRVYLLFAAADSQLTLGVFDAATLSLQGVLPLAEHCPAGIACDDAAIAVDLNLDRIDVVGSVGSAPAHTVSPRWAFDRLP